MEGDVERLRDNFSKIKDITRIWRLFFIVLDLKNLHFGALEFQSIIEWQVQS